MGNCLRMVFCCKFNRIEAPSPALSTSKEEIRECTVLVVGNIAVGKTTLINCLISKQKQNDQVTERTNTVDTKSKTMQVRDTTLKLNFVDLAGNMHAADLIRL